METNRHGTKQDLAAAKKDKGADFVYFVDITTLPADVIEEYTCAVLFGKALSKEYISAIRNG